jgi:hypothetical protein
MIRASLQIDWYWLEGKSVSSLGFYRRKEELFQMSSYYSYTYQVVCFYM